MKVAILGFGTVGFGVYELLNNNENIEVAYVLDLKKHEGLSAQSVTDIGVILADDTVDTVIELIGGMNPAYDFIKAALSAGKNVISANKFVLCEHYKELTALANKNNVALRYTAAVGGGIQWLVNLERMLTTDTVSSITGIMNGTTNFILDQMHSTRCDYNNALKTAQELGYAEADPSADTEGLDALRKIILSANIAFSASLSSADADVLGISNIYSEDIAAAESIGCVCRLLTNAKKTGDSIAVWVEPSFVDAASSFGCVSKNLNYIMAQSKFAGSSGFFGQGAGRYPTAYTVANDCVDVANGVKHPYNPICNEAKIDNSITLRYYIRTEINDEWLSSVADKPLGSGIITKPISVSELHKNIKRIRKSDLGCFAAALVKENI